MAEQSPAGAPVAANRLIGRRLSANARKPEVLHGDEGSRFTQNAFLDKRGNLSVDAFWKENSLKPAGIEAYVQEMHLVCKKEGHEISGWAMCKVSYLLQDAKAVLESVVHTPTATNPNHAELVRRTYLATAEGDPEALHKAQVIAKLLAELFNNHGRFQTTK